MQALYAPGLAGTEKSVEQLRKKFAESHQLYLYLFYVLTEIMRYAEKEASIRAGKNLPTKEDLEVNIKISGNDFLWKILESPFFKEGTEKFDSYFPATAAVVKKVFRGLAVSPIYLEYIKDASRNKPAERDIIKYIFTDLMLPNEDVIAVLEEYFTNWQDDAEMMNKLVLNNLQKPGSFSYEAFISTEKAIFGESLLLTVLEKGTYLKSMITPKLKNWDVERIALLDMIIMQMGIAEFLFFESIPTKVTINEYIDIAKEYSTLQSGHFVNGILDNLHKELITADKIHKVAYKVNATR